MKENAKDTVPAYWYSGRPESRAEWHALRDVMKQYGATATRAAGCNLTDSIAAAISTHNRQLFDQIKGAHGTTETQIMEQVNNHALYYEQIARTLPSIAAYQQLHQALPEGKSLDFKIEVNEWQEAVVRIFHFDGTEKPDTAPEVLLTLGIKNDRAVVMQPRDTAFAQFERAYTPIGDPRHNPIPFKVKPLTLKEWEAASAISPPIAIENDTLPKALINNATTLLQITKKDIFYATALPGGNKVDNGHTIQTELSFEGWLTFASKQHLHLQVNEWIPEAVLLPSPSELWVKVKLLYPNDNGDRVLQKSTSDYIRLLLPFRAVPSFP